jgi:hypothetical protein
MKPIDTGKTVRFILDPASPPKMSEATKARLAALRDEDIDLSDIPATTAQDWQGAVRGKFCRPIKPSR